jgi:protein phosphatase PTC1
MIVRFDNKALKLRKTEAQMGVDRDATKTGISEADAIVSQARKEVGESEVPVESAAADMIKEEEEQEPGPELNIDAAKAAQKHPGSG